MKTAFLWLNFLAWAAFIQYDVSYWRDQTELENAGSKDCVEQYDKFIAIRQKVIDDYNAADQNGGSFTR